MDHSRRGELYSLLYDGACPVCVSLVERVRRWDRLGALEFLPIGDPEASRLFPELSSEALQESLHLVGPGGRVWRGARAVEELTRILPPWRWAAPLFRIPLARPLAARVYRWVALNRFRLGCAGPCVPESDG